MPNKNHQYLWGMILIALLGLLSYYLKGNTVFPSASIDLKVPKSEILKLTDIWASRLGFDPSGAIKSTIFSFDDDAKTFLEYELGLDRANQLMKDEIPVWYWSTRLCRQLKLEEFTTGLS